MSSLYPYVKFENKSNDYEQVRALVEKLRIENKENMKDFKNYSPKKRNLLKLTKSQSPIATSTPEVGMKKKLIIKPMNEALRLSTITKKLYT